MTDFKAYTEFCKTTESLPSTVDVNIDDLRMAMSVVVKGNELLDIIKKNAFYGKSFNREQWQNKIAELNKAIAAGSESSRKALTHTAKPEALNFDVRVGHSIIGINTESGELLENMMDVVFNDKEFDNVNFGEEVGDLMWYTAIGLDATGQQFDQCLDTNKAKLQARYNKGKFTSEDAIERDLDNERTILTKGVTSSEEVEPQQTTEPVRVETVVEPEVEPEKPKKLFGRSKKSKG